MDGPHPSARTAPLLGWLAAALFAAGLALAVSRSQASADPPARTISFSGYTWQVKASSEPVGPGPNVFSDAPASVWVDRQGRLHLRIAEREGQWTSAEVVNTRSLGYGRYRFDLASPVGALDPNAVLGLFTWSDDPAYANREIDVEFSRFAAADDPTNGQYVVPPYTRAGHLLRFVQPPAARTAVSFDWRPGSVSFAGPAGWTYRGADVPPPGGEHARINLWLYRGAPPAGNEPVEVVVNAFRFTPARRR
jgi:hypothetical protein